MDGNGRWARSRGKPRLFGHKAGTQNIRRVIERFADYNVGHLTLYAFSTENWDRPSYEVRGLMALLSRFLKRETQNLHEEGIRLLHIGDLSPLGQKLQKQIGDAIELTKDNQRMTLAIAFNYGGRAEIVDAVRRIVTAGVASEEIDEALFDRYLFTHGLPDPDLIIRTAGENADLELPALAGRLRRVLFHERLLAGLRRAAHRRGAECVQPPPPALRRPPAGRAGRPGAQRKRRLGKRQRQRPQGIAATGMLAQRLLTAAVGIPIVIAVILIGGHVFTAVACVILGLGALEFVHMAQREDRPLWQPSAAAIAAVGGVVAVTIASDVAVDEWPPELVAAVGIAMLYILIRGVPWIALPWWAAIVGAMAYVGILGSYLVPLRNLDRGESWVLLAVVSTWGADTCAYAIGKLVGRHKMAPSISPGKTWEGTIGGLAGGAGGGRRAELAAGPAGEHGSGRLTRTDSADRRCVG